jgi:transposase
LLKPTPSAQEAFTAKSNCGAETREHVRRRGQYLRALAQAFPRLGHIFADRLQRGDKLLNAIAAFGAWKIQIVTRSQSIGSFKPEPKPWVI